MLFGGIEAGGTKMVCAVADENGNLLNRMTIPTTTPDETIAKMVDYFDNYKIKALGIGCFGPLDIEKGKITNTPKLAWKNVEIVSLLKKKLDVPIGFDTDVNAAMLGEVRFGAAQDVDSAIYITVGTGIGVGVYMNGRLVHGRMHPEAGHMYIRPHESDMFEGACPYHRNCFEGLASGPAIKARWGKVPQELYNEPEVWRLESFYIGQAIVNYIMAYSPEKIILWGGVMHKDGLLDLVIKEVKAQLGNYVDMPDIVLPMLGDNPGIIGATQLGYDIWRK